jgi:hypothetical protein
MVSILLCVILRAFTFTFMHRVIYMWLWDLWHVCSLLQYLYVMSLGYAHLPCFRVSWSRFFCVWYFMHSRLLSCIVLYTCDCETCDMCTLYFDIYMSYHLVMLICLASAFHSDSIEHYFLYSCLFHIMWVHCVSLGHISMPSPFCSYRQMLLWTKHVENLTHSLYKLEVLLSSITKKGEIESI